MTTKRFKVVNHLTLPSGLQAGPGATVLCCEPGSTIELDSDQCNGEFARFVSGRVRAGDLIELADTVKRETKV